MQILTEWITGCMVGIEWSTFPLEGYDDTEKGNAFILDLAILRFIFVW
jgi:hypothetical protein